MPRQPNPRVLRQLDLRDPEWDGLVAFAAQVYPGRSLHDVVRELLRVGLQHDPLDAAVATARARAYRDAQVELRQRIGLAMRQVTADFEAATAMLDGMEPTAVVDPATRAHQTGHVFDGGGTL